jgi:hypothetical protein
MSGPFKENWKRLSNRLPPQNLSNNDSVATRILENGQIQTQHTAGGDNTNGLYHIYER